MKKPDGLELAFHSRAELITSSKKMKRGAREARPQFSKFIV